MSETNETLRKLDESFGTLTSDTTTNTEAAVTDKSEDDKQTPMADDLHLNFDTPSTNDAPEQKVPETVSKAMQVESAKIQVRNNLDEADGVLNSLKETTKSLEELKDQDEEEVKEAVKKVASMDEQEISKLEEYIDGLKQQIEEDPMKAAGEIGKAALMVIGGVTVLKTLFGRRR